MTIILIIAGILLAAVVLQAKEPPVTSRDIERMLPVWKLEQDVILSRNGDMTIAFDVTLPEIFTLSNNEYNALHATWLKAIRVLPVNTVLHKQDIFIRAAYKAKFTEDQDFMQRSSELFFNERPYLEHSCYLMITLKSQDRKAASSAFSNLLRKTLVSPEAVNGKLVQQLLDSAGQFRRILSDGGLVGLRRLTTEEISGTPEAPGLLERYLFLQGAEDKPKIKDIVFKPEWKIGENFLQLYTLADTEDLPGSCSPHINYERYSTDKSKFSIGFASPAGQLLPVNHIYNQYMVISDTPKTLKRLEARRRRLQSLSAYSRENAISRDAVSDFLNEAISQGRQPIKAHFSLLCWTDKRDELKDLRNQAASALAGMEAVPHLEVSGAPQLWWAGLPGNEGDLPENECFETFAEQATCLLNMETAYRSSNSPFGIRLGDRLTGVPLHVDISDEPMKRGITTNRNKIVVGGSGSGKSMFMCHMLRSYVQQGAHCVVVDVGRSYDGLCELVGGYYFAYTEDNPIRFNPFYIAPGDVLDTEKKESIKTLLVALWKQGDESFRRSEYVAISNALQSYYSFLGKYLEIFPCFNTFYEFLQEHFVRELEDDKVKDRDFDIANFLYVLRPFYHQGEFDYLLNATENLDILQQPFIVFELDNIAGHGILFSVVTLIIAELFISKMRKLKGIRKVIVIEEAWKAIARAGMADFIKYLYKTVRKYFGEAITVTQEVDDLVSSPVIKEAIINNADVKIFLDLKKFQNKFEPLQATMGMTEKGRDLVLSINRANEPGRNYREVYIELGNQDMKVYRYEPSRFEYYAFTTEQPEKVKVRQSTEKHGDMRKGIAALVEDEKNGKI
ncbi:TraG family conjugative transposon ATPase [Dinghuibacter silviterrae]|uniref:Conjugation system TraG family ATPase n=1 Tax=Dinghuibacter silviterrae TaxID=1539049 RepID=A0A4R8DQS1_9BACT|nr:TraG family conjugative transposon ATPase [Dinghuibacter silviterrae]TDX00504.1 conjugation system TraG family ATPase [Dinghuibacter silviterrae]